jgi:hypothetical protein
LVVGADAQPEDHQVGVDGDAVVQHHAGRLAGGLTDGGETGTGNEADTLTEQARDRSGSAISPSSGGRTWPTFSTSVTSRPRSLSLLGDLEADEARADHRHLLRGRSWARMRSMSSMLRSECTPSARTPGTAGMSGAGPGARIKLVVGLVVSPSRRRGRGCDAVFLAAIDRKGLVADADFDVEAFLEHLGLGDEQLARSWMTPPRW